VEAGDEVGGGVGGGAAGDINELFMLRCVVLLGFILVVEEDHESG